MHYALPCNSNTLYRHVIIKHNFYVSNYIKNASTEHLFIKCCNQNYQLLSFNLRKEVNWPCLVSWSLQNNASAQPSRSWMHRLFSGMYLRSLRFSRGRHSAPMRRNIRRLAIGIDSGADLLQSIQTRASRCEVARIQTMLKLFLKCDVTIYVDRNVNKPSR